MVKGVHSEPVPAVVVDNVVIFSGTVPLLNGFTFGTNFRYEMVDEVLNRKITSDYNVIAISEEER